jgi:hypothetical protein
MQDAEIDGLVTNLVVNGDRSAVVWALSRTRGRSRRQVGAHDVAQHASNRSSLFPADPCRVRCRPGGGRRTRRRARAWCGRLCDQGRTCCRARRRGPERRATRVPVAARPAPGGHSRARTRRPAVAERHLLVGVRLLRARRGASTAQQAPSVRASASSRRGADRSTALVYRVASTLLIVVGSVVDARGDLGKCDSGRRHHHSNTCSGGSTCSPRSPVRAGQFL